MFALGRIEVKKVTCLTCAGTQTIPTYVDAYRSDIEVLGRIKLETQHDYVIRSLVNITTIHRLFCVLNKIKDIVSY